MLNGWFLAVNGSLNKLVLFQRLSKLSEKGNSSERFQGTALRASDLCFCYRACKMSFLCSNYGKEPVNDKTAFPLSRW